MVDIHTHILPGLDDGAKSLAEALEMARIAVADGVSALAATPHVVSGLYDNPPELIREEVDVLNRYLAEEGIPLPILPGAEYRLEPDLPQRLNQGQLVTINDTGRYLLVELPFSLVPDHTEQILYEIQLQGVVPIIAHPERNPGLIRNPERLFRLVQRGVLAQVTTSSIQGRFGKTVKRTALNMLETGTAQVVASDAHSTRGRSPATAAAAQEIEARGGAEFAQTVLSINPRRIIAGEMVEPVLPEPEVGFLARVWRSLSR